MRTLLLQVAGLGLLAAGLFVAPWPAKAEFLPCSVGVHCQLENQNGQYMSSYGVENRFFYLETEGQPWVHCGHELMGDPYYGKQKSCEFQELKIKNPNEHWTTCANQNETCKIQLNPSNQYRQVRYGKENQWVYRFASNDFTCNAHGLAVNIDPAINVFKECQLSSIVNSTTWKPCGGEGAICRPKGGGTHIVRYGANGKHHLQLVSGNEITCGSPAFLWDPYVNVHKFCAVANHIAFKSINGHWKNVAKCRGEGKCKLTRTLETGVTQGSESSKTSEWTTSLSIAMEQSFGVPGVGEAKVTATVGVSNTNSKTISQSFETSSSQSTGAECDGRSLWQWETTVTEYCNSTGGGGECVTVASSTDWACRDTLEAPPVP